MSDFAERELRDTSSFTEPELRDTTRETEDGRAVEEEDDALREDIVSPNPADVDAVRRAHPGEFAAAEEEVRRLDERYSSRPSVALPGTGGTVAGIVFNETGPNETGPNEEDTNEEDK